MKALSTALACLVLCACQTGRSTDSAAALSPSEQERLQQVVATQSAETQARYSYRHPEQTLQFFGIKPGMTVVEILPGGGWYSSILAPYLGPEGKLIGIDYSLDMMENFDWVTADFIEERKKWGAQWQAKAKDWPGGKPAKLESYNMDTIPASLDGEVDAVLFIRALHNLSRFEPIGGYRTFALQRAYELLKPGGTLGVVQHQVGEERASTWADGSRGYMKKSDVIKLAENAGFKFVGASAVNENPKDQPTEDEQVWRLPPSYYTSKDNPQLQAEYKAIGESNRMTLLFTKP